MKKANLDDRIAAAFGDGVKSDAVAALIKETEAAAVTANEAADKARARALDPALAAVAEARRTMEDAAFTRDRLQAALPRLQDRLAELRAAEEDARRRAVYNAAKAERDKLAEELARVYPPLVDQLVHLMTRLAASDQALYACNRALPKGAEHLPTAEEIARGLFAYERAYCKEKGRRLDPRLPRLATELKLPKFEAADGRMFVWPPETKGLSLNELARLVGKEAA